MTTLTNTPWGNPDSGKHIGDGIVFYSTPSHGGYRVPAEKLAEMPKALREFRTFAGHGWYEEDCDAVIVILAFPHLFNPQHVFYAIDAVKSYRPYFDAVAPWLLTAEAVTVCHISALCDEEQRARRAA
jgi:hypothetical protein